MAEQQQIVSSPVTVFYSYAQADEQLCRQLEKHLSTLRQQGVISEWRDRQIVAGTEREQVIVAHLNTASLILLLISPDYLNSGDCYGEMRRALERHERGDAHVIPILLRPVDWGGAPFAHLQVLPKNQQSVTSWPDRDRAFLDIATGIRTTLEELHSSAGTVQRLSVPTWASSGSPAQITSCALQGFLPPTDPRTIEQRQHLVEDIYTRLIQPDTTAMVLTGIAGVGKSTLAALVYNHTEEQRVASRGPFATEGIWLTVHDSTTLTDLAGTVLGVLGKPLADFSRLSPHSQVLSLLNALNVTSKPRLVVLDQFEYLLDAQTGQALAAQPGVAELLDALNSHPCRCRVLLTSRPRPRGTREYPFTYLQEYPVVGLDLTEGRTLLRKQGVQETDAVLQQAVKRCDGHAYAMVLLTSLVRDHRTSLTALLEDATLWTGDIATKLLDSIYTGQLNEVQRELLRAFSVYREAVPLGASQAVVTNTPAALLPPALKVLRTQQLLQAAGEGRYQLHAIVAQYAQDHFDEHDEQSNRQALQAAHARAARYYQQQAAQCPSREKRQQMSDVQPLVEGVWQLCQAGQWQTAYTVLEQEDLFADLSRWGGSAILVGLCQLLLPLDKWNPEPVQSLRFTVHLGQIYERLGRLEEARTYYEEALKASKEMGERGGESTVLNNLGGIYLDLGKIKEAQRCYEQALIISKEDGLRREEGIRLSNLGGLYQSLGKMEQAQNHYEEALKVSREVGDRGLEGATLNNLGAVYDDLGKREMAQHYYEEALQISREVGDRKGESVALNNLGFVCNELGRLEEACTYKEEALRIRREIEDRMGEGALLNNLGRIYEELGRIEEAGACYEQALSILRETGNRVGEGAALHNLGCWYTARGQHENAERCLEEALGIRREVGDRVGEGTTLNSLGGVCTDVGKKEEAWKYHEQALAISREVGDHDGEGMALWCLSMRSFEQRQYDVGLAYLLAARGIFEEIQRPECHEIQRWIDALREHVGEESFDRLLTQLEQD